MTEEPTYLLHGAESFSVANFFVVCVGRNEKPVRLIRHLVYTNIHIPNLVYEVQQGLFVYKQENGIFLLCYVELCVN
jgi:hypothetical protein